MTRKELLAKINTLDAIEDHLEIVQLSSFYEFYWDNTRALEFALFRTFAVPSIGKLLDHTQEFGKRPQKRYDDTDLILNEIIENGYDSERGRAALERMNQMHGRYKISNDDMRYVLSTFVAEPYRWNQKFGYRLSTEKENIAGHRLWYEIGKRMGIKDIPETFEAMLSFNVEYEKANFAYSEGGRKVADATINLMLGWFLPKFTWELFRPFAHALMDERLLNALHLKKAPWLVRSLVQFGMNARKVFLPYLPLRKNPVLRTQRKTDTYPKGYKIQDLGV